MNSRNPNITGMTRFGFIPAMYTLNSRGDMIGLQIKELREGHMVLQEVSMDMHDTIVDYRKDPDRTFLGNPSKDKGSETLVDKGVEHRISEVVLTNTIDPS